MRKVMEQIRVEIGQVGKEIEDMERKLYQKQRVEGVKGSDSNNQEDGFSSHHSDE